jgi:hypothetical protein
MSQVRHPHAPGFAVTSATAIFLGAFLLFQVQPMMGKMILPWFGGTPAVWTTCMLFFQVLLLAGYAYADLLNRWRGPAGQALLHAVLLGAAVWLLPIAPGAGWKPPDGEHPTGRILLLLAACVGLPYFLLSATSPLIQAWFARVYPGRSPYRLYALSNIGSLGALLSYPFVVEPAWTTAQQGTLWSGTFVAFGGVCGLLTWQLWRSRAALMAGDSARDLDQRIAEPKPARKEEPREKLHGGPRRALSTAQDASPFLAGRPSWRDRLVWLLLPALASMMLLAVTNHLCQDVAVVPFLWIVPLSLYLLSFIICFDRDRWYVRRWFSLGAMVAILAACDLAFLAYIRRVREPSDAVDFWDLLRYDIRVVIGVYLTLFFFLCMVCHGEVARRRPVASRLTEFYLTVSAGGALGGFVVAVVCPNWCSSFVELKLGLCVGFVLSLVVFLVDGHRRWFRRLSKPLRMLGGVLSAAVAAVVGCAQWVSWDHGGALAQVRNFYGVLTVREWFSDEPEHHGQALYHGAILHGYQFLEEKKRLLPTAYFVEQSGVGRALQAARRGRPLHVGIVGLGAGTLAAYGQTGDSFRFYEINPLVIDLAWQPFTFLSQSAARIEVISGDARLSLERESPQHFDVLVLDAFSGDSIPVHLLTREAFELYLRHLQPDGAIALHVSNRYVDLIPVVVRLAEVCGLARVMISQGEARYLEMSPSDWILLARDRQSFDRPGIREVAESPMVDRAFPIWTDQYNNLFQILRRPGARGTR